MQIDDYRIRGGLSRDQIDIMHEKALYLIENSGIKIPHEGIKKRLAEYDGVRIENDMVALSGSSS